MALLGFFFFFFPAKHLSLLILNKGLYIRLPLRTAARIRAYEPPPGPFEGAGQLLLCLPWVLQRPPCRGFSQPFCNIGLKSISISCLSPWGCAQRTTRQVSASVVTASCRGRWGGRGAWGKDIRAGSNVVKIWDHYSGFRESGDNFMPALILGREACPPEDYHQASVWLTEGLMQGGIHKRWGCRLREDWRPLAPLTTQGRGFFPVGR